MTTVAAAGFIALTLSLAFWQVNRAGEKSRRQALYDARLADAPVRLTGSVASPDALLFRQVRASGEWIAHHQVFIDNQIRGARAGFHVVTPLRIEGSRDAVLVNRGWIARSRDYPRPPAVDVPQGRVEVSGLATRPPARYLELSSETIAGSVWQNLSLERYRRHTGLEVLPIVVLMDSAPPGLSVVREQPDAGIARHHEYALTWFALAATALVLWVALNLRRIR